MSDDRDDRSQRREQDFRIARIGAAAVLICVTGVNIMVDPWLTSYEVDALVIFNILAIAAALLGVEMLDFLRKITRPNGKD